jgi:hypothetical protein
MKMQIYCLIDPNTLKVKYIGRTKKENLNHRLTEHISCSIYSHKYHPTYKKTHKENWICELHKNKQKPLIRKLAQIEGREESYILEKKLINKYHSRLLNTNDRGVGGYNKIITDLQKQKISQTIKKHYADKLMKVQGERTFYVYDKNANFLYEKTNLTHYAKELGIPFRRITKTLNFRAVYYHDYIFSYQKCEKLIHNFKHISTKKKINPFPLYCKFMYKVLFKDTNENHIVYSLSDLVKLLNIKNKKLVFEKILLTVKFKKLNIIIEKCPLIK